jgi:hypothetical protein
MALDFVGFLGIATTFWSLVFALFVTFVATDLSAEESPFSLALVHQKEPSER